jgi:hypothetical protein
MALTGQFIAKNICRLIAAQDFDWITGASIVPIFSRGPQGSDNDAESDSTQLPKILVSCAHADITAPFSGGWRGTVEIDLVSNADDTAPDDHDARFAELAEVFMDRDAAKASLSEYPGFACYLLVVMSQDHGIEGRSYFSRLTLEGEFSTFPTATV